MPRPAGRPDGQETRAPRAAAVLRGAGFALAVALGAVAVWLIVTSTTQKRLELGVLAGLWGLLLGAFCAFGTRRGQREELMVRVPGPAQELAIRAAGNVELADESAARRHFEARLEQMLRQEIQTTLGREIASLRDEVASLRNDLLEKVGGQLRLERIETTRVIGSDIEALQREIDQLKHGHPLVDAAGPITRTIPRVIETSPVPPPPQPQPVQPAPPQPAPVQVVQEPQPAPVQVVQEPQPAQAQPPVQRPGGGDFFADLPRLRPFTDFELDPVPSSPAEPHGTDDPAVAEQAQPPMLAPRRPESGRAATGRHGRADDAARGGGGGRRRRANDDEDNVLARILARESAK
jgi:hypothetical protein